MLKLPSIFYGQKVVTKKIDKLWLKQCYLTITLRTYKANKCKKTVEFYSEKYLPLT